MSKPNYDQRPSHAYVGRCAGCGGFLASRVDMRDRDTGQSVGAMIESGLLVERMPLEQVRLGDCTCAKLVQESLLGDPLLVKLGVGVDAGLVG